MTEQDKKEIMNLIKAKKIIKQKEQTDDIWQEVMDKALAEIDRLKVELRNAGKVIEEYINKPSEASTDLWQRGYQEGFKQAKFDCEMDKLNEPKEIDKLEEKLMYALSPTNHELAESTKQGFKKIVRENLDKDTYTIRKLLKDFWEGL